MPADAGGEVGRTNAVARFTDEELLHHPILERLKSYDREPAAGTQDRHGGDETLLEIRKLVVHRDAQRLEDTRGGIGPAPALLLLHTEHESSEVVCREERLARTAAHDRGGYARRFGLLAVAREDVAKVVLIPAVHDVRRRDGESWIGAHVQRSFRAKAEAPLRVRELDRREAKIEKDAVELVEAVTAGQDVAKREVALSEDGAVAEAREDAVRLCERCGIDVEPEKAAIRRAPIEDGFGMPSPTDRAVEKAATFAGIKLGEYFGQKNRLMKPP